jgi:hypothetical protein
MMQLKVIGVLVLIVAVLVAILWAQHMIKSHGLFVMIGRWHLGQALDGQRRTNATWSQPATKALHVTGRAHRWHWLTGRRRAAMRWGGEITLGLVVWGWFAARRMTIIALMIVVAAAVAGIVLQIIWKVSNWRHEREYVNPLEATLMYAVGVPPVTIEIERADDSDAIESVAPEWAPEVEIGAPQKDRIIEAVETRLAIEAPEPA